MDSQKRLSLLQNMLARLTGAEPAEAPALKAAEPVKPPPSAVDPNARRLQLLQSMLSKLQGS